MPGRCGQRAGSAASLAEAEEGKPRVTPAVPPAGPPRGPRGRGGAGERRPQLLDRKLGWCWLRLGARSSARRPGSVERAEVVPAGPWGLRRPGRARGWSPALGRTLPGSLGGAPGVSGSHGGPEIRSVPPSGVPLDKEMEITPARGLTRMWPGGARSWAPVWGGRLGVLGRGGTPREKAGWAGRPAGRGWWVPGCCWCLPCPALGSAEGRHGCGLAFAAQLPARWASALSPCNWTPPPPPRNG